MKKFFVWFTAALFLVILADITPKVAVWLAVLLVVGVLLTNTDVYTSFFNDAVSSIKG